MQIIQWHDKETHKEALSLVINQTLGLLIWVHLKGNKVLLHFILFFLPCCIQVKALGNKQNSVYNGSSLHSQHHAHQAAKGNGSCVIRESANTTQIPIAWWWSAIQTFTPSLPAIALDDVTVFAMVADQKAERTQTYGCAVTQKHSAVMPMQHRYPFPTTAAIRSATADKKKQTSTHHSTRCSVWTEGHYES